MDSTSPRLGEKVTDYSAVCLETGEVEEMEVEQTCTAESSATFPALLRASHTESLIVIWDNAPAHHGEPIRYFLSTPNLRLRLVPLPGYSPDFNTDEAIWDWARAEATANICLGTKAEVRQKMGRFFVGLGQRTGEIQQRCRTVLQAKADELVAATAKHVSTSPVALGLVPGAAPGAVRGVPRARPSQSHVFTALFQANYVDSTLALV